MDEGLTAAGQWPMRCLAENGKALFEFFASHEKKE
jgi:hypothetical protein